MLRIESLGKRFGNKAALANVSMEIGNGTFVGVIGRSGAGKSTLLRCINRLVDPSEGRISLDGRDVTFLRGQALRDWRASCGMIFQQFNLAGRLDVLTNVLMGRINSIALLPAMLKTWPEKKIVMDALKDLNRERGITVMCNLHSLDLARTYCERLIGMREGQVVFDGPPSGLSDAAVIDLYGLEANDVLELPETPAGSSEESDQLRNVA
jgi:ABC-type phosphate/phosphonate transport system ATPase subunit